ncbi:hypothetical protein D9758_016451 [Tetrapyrgos nigripes]|uniref:Uncharacterized protein n=1 Tax=Tetrapyrgos nigripes TaxID=182062 RepID=A0A8H5FJ39_9AGAR|nr:hypothetical protein D9758_016451 [Tetrapyrgos nigripes]
MPNPTQELDSKLCQLLPPSPTKSGLLCGRHKATQFLPVPSIPPQFFAGASPTLRPPLFHYGFPFTHQQLAEAANALDLLVKSAGLLDHHDEDSHQDDTEGSDKEDTEGSDDTEDSDEDDTEGSDDNNESSGLPDIDVPNTLLRIRAYLRDRGFDFPYLRYTCGACRPGPMISILTNYQYKMRFTMVELGELKKVLGRNDEPVWDLDADSKGWTYVSLKGSR